MYCMWRRYEPSFDVYNKNNPYAIFSFLLDCIMSLIIINSLFCYQSCEYYKNLVQTFYSIKHLTIAMHLTLYIEHMSAQIKDGLLMLIIDNKNSEVGYRTWNDGIVSNKTENFIVRFTYILQLALGSCNLFTSKEFKWEN